jgi:hypothetical protein
MHPLRFTGGGADVAADLTTRIADALAESGEYVAAIGLLPTQQLVDLHWAAHQAGRRVGLKVAVTVRPLKGASDRAEVRVAPRRPVGPR